MKRNGPMPEVTARRNEPPIKSRVIYRHPGGWWGTQWALVKSPIPDDLFDHKVEFRTDAIQAILHAATDQIPGAPVQFGTRYKISEGTDARRLILAPGRAVDADFLDWAEAEAKPEQWQQIEINLNEAIVGIKDGEPVAFIASRKATA